MFELSSPMVDAEDSFKPMGDEDIFNLEELQEIKNDKSDFDIPEIDFAEEERQDTDAVRAASRARADEDTGRAARRGAARPSRPIDLPITLEIPDGCRRHADPPQSEDHPEKKISAPA